jgi:hypothetical protein
LLAGMTGLSLTRIKREAGVKPVGWPLQAESGPSLRAGDRQKPAYSGRFDLSVQWCVFSGKQTYRWGRGLMGEKINWSSIDHSFLSAMFHLFEFSTGSSNLTFETN